MNLSVVGAIVVLVLVAASALWYYQSRAIAEQRLLTRLVRDQEHPVAVLRPFVDVQPL
jgi:hypothetical protein